jgi:hypothetical protein
MKLCKDCAFFKPADNPMRGRTYALCEHPKLPVDPVDGTRDAISCREMRAEVRTILLARAEARGYFCGAAGNLFEPNKPPKKWRKFSFDDACMPGEMASGLNFVVNGLDDVPSLVGEGGVMGRTDDEAIENARRIAACWNAFSGIETDEIERKKFKIVRAA